MNVNDLYDYHLYHGNIKESGRIDQTIKELEVEARRTLVYTAVLLITLIVQMVAAPLYFTLGIGLMISLHIIVVASVYAYYLHECMVIEKYKYHAIKDLQYKEEV